MPASQKVVQTDNFTATGTGGATGLRSGRANFTIWGVFVGTVVLERSFDKGATWIACTNLGQLVSFTGPATEVLYEPEEGVQYRARCTAFTSGTINTRISQ